jgi:hypothetical protein
MLCAQRVVPRKVNLSHAMWKKKYKLSAKNKDFHKIFFVFTQHKNTVFVLPFLCTHIDIFVMQQKFRIFQLEMGFFCERGHMHLEAEMDLRHNLQYKTYVLGYICQRDSLFFKKRCQAKAHAHMH